MKKNYQRLFLLSTLLFGLIFGCTPEEEQIINETETVQDITVSPLERTFTLMNFKEIDGILNGGLEVDWSSSTEKQMNNGRTLHEFKATPITSKFLESEVQLPDQFFVLGELDDSGNAYTWIVKIKPDITAAPIDYSYINLKDYSGSIVHYDLKGNILRMEGWQKGKGISLVENTDEPQPNIPDSMAATCQQRNSLANFGGGDPFDPCPGGGGGSWVPIYTHEYKDWYVYRGNGLWEESNTTYHGISNVEYIWIPSTGTTAFYQSNTTYHGYYPGSGNTQQLITKPNAPTQPIRIVNRIEDKPCQSEVINIANFIDSPITETVLALFAGNTSMELEYKLGDFEQEFGSNTVARTSYELDSNGNIKDGLITITYDTDLFNSATDLSLFSTTIHENIHAILFAHLDLNLIDINDENGDLSALANEWAEQEAVVRAGGNPDDIPLLTLGALQHEAMSDLVSTMQDALRTFGESRGYLLDDFYYEALAWQGLEETVTFATLSEEEKDAIRNIIANEITGFEILAEGTSCN
ncbi:hypothetical protein [Flagellimonas sp.]|uniref:hypothetical protein n=1 Tax=Flagellimonas sp. TaxID=2058762 RepID=UPI003B513AA9